MSENATPASGHQETPAEPEDALLEAFWTRAKNVAKINPLEVIVGTDSTSALRPSAFSMGDSPEQADHLCQLVVDGVKRATSSWLASYRAEDAPLPEVGELSIICDGAGAPHALTRTTKVATVAFQEAGPEIAEAEGEGTFEEWKSEHEAFFRRECQQVGIEFEPDGEVLTEYFEVLYKY
ncbi:MAG: ASCH domain-containing protein [Ancrocorticia sp.]|uniref:ASCH domain-containing protein n=1 Tax=Ancrocorticia sp. TaxID=2593684 RepID=UPI003F8EEAC0